MDKKTSGFAAYGTASGLAAAIIAPLLVFICGGGWLIEKYNLPEWATPLSVVLGITFMIGSAISFFCRLIRMCGENADKSRLAAEYRETERKLNINKRENDYYAD